MVYVGLVVVMLLIIPGQNFNAINEPDVYKANKLSVWLGQQGSLIYSPNTSDTETLMESIRQMNDAPPTKVIGFANEQQLTDYYSFHNGSDMDDPKIVW